MTLFEKTLYESLLELQGNRSADPKKPHVSLDKRSQKVFAAVMAAHKADLAETVTYQAGYTDAAEMISRIAVKTLTEGYRG